MKLRNNARKSTMRFYLYLLIFAHGLWNPPSDRIAYHISVDEMYDKLQLDKRMDKLAWIYSDISR